MKRLSMRTARRTPEQQAQADAEAALKAKQVEDAAKAAERETRRRGRVNKMKEGTTRRMAYPSEAEHLAAIAEAQYETAGPAPSRVPFDQIQNANRVEAVATLRQWFRRNRNREGYYGAVRLQEFGNRKLCQGRMIVEHQTAGFHGGRVEADGYLLAFNGAEEGRPPTHPQFLGMRTSGSAFRFDSTIAAIAAARHAASLPLGSPQIMPTCCDDLFLQVSREVDYDDGGCITEKSTFFAEVPDAGPEFSNVVMIVAESEDFMGHHEIGIKAFNFTVVDFVPTRWERFFDRFKPKGRKASDFRGKEKVRFEPRPGSEEEWLDRDRLTPVSMRPSEYPV